MIDRHLASLRVTRNARVVVPCPIDFPPTRRHQIWHARSQHADAQRWTRGLLQAEAGRLQVPPRPVG